MARRQSFWPKRHNILFRFYGQYVRFIDINLESYNLVCMKNPFESDLFYHTIGSPFGPVTILWSLYMGHPKIFRIVLPTPDGTIGLNDETMKTMEPRTCGQIDRVARDMTAYFKGSDIMFSLAPLRLETCSEFMQRVLLAEAAIPWGRVSSYQRIAQFIKAPTSARAVGRALARNPFPIVLPCHRAIRTDRTLGGFQGGLKMKRALLEMEGVNFDPLSRVEVFQFFL